MFHYEKDIDSAFQGAGSKPGLQIWCIESLQLFPVPKSSYGKFFSGSAYIILNTVLLKNGYPHHDIHYWLGKGSKEVEAALASEKALELDAGLGSHAVQYKEVQGQETEKFLSYFRPCIIPIEGVFKCRPGNLEDNAYPVSLLTCKGDRVVHVKEVPFARSSLNHNDVFILDTASKIFLFSGCNSTVQERAKAVEVVQYIKEHKHNGSCEVAAIDDGKFVGDPDVGEFWSLFGGYAPIPRDSPSAFQEGRSVSNVKLFWITAQGKLSQTEMDSLNRKMLSSDKCYLLDCGTELYIWMGRNTLLTERKASIAFVEDFLRLQSRSNESHLTFVAEGSETNLFKSYFADWPQKVEPTLYEEGREKVAAIFKQHGYDVKELPDDEDEPSFDVSGILKVWWVNGEEVTLLPTSKQRMLYSGNCYVVQYTYPGNGREENLFYAWFGRQSVEGDRADAVSYMNYIVNLIKGGSVLAQIFEEREPIQFFLIFQSLIIFKGGNSSRYKSSVEEKGILDETFNSTKTALFRIQGTSSNNMQAIQVDQVSRSLNSSFCFVLKTETSVFTWIGNMSTFKDHDLLDRMLNLIDQSWQPILVREGSEPDLFWNALGGKTEYPRQKVIKRYLEDPHLFTCTFIGGDFKVKEIFNFTQDDLTTEDVLILDCHEEIYVWIGNNSHVKSKQEALTLGLKILENGILVEGVLSLETPLYVVSEGYEPSFFTRFFEWDLSKANMLGNSFERKLAILKGKTMKLEVQSRSSWKPYSNEDTPDSSKSQSNGLNRMVRSSSPASAISHSTSRQLFQDSSTDPGSRLEQPVARTDSATPKINETDISADIYPYERVKVASSDPVTGIDATRREAYLSDTEFQEKFGMSRDSFYRLPKWRQNKLKISLHLF